MHCCCHDWWSRELRLTSASVCVSLYSDDKSGDEKSDDDQDDNSRPMTQEELRIRMRKKVAGAREPVNRVSSNVSRAMCVSFSFIFTFSHHGNLLHLFCCTCAQKCPSSLRCPVLRVCARHLCVNVQRARAFTPTCVMPTGANLN